MGPTVAVWKGAGVKGRRHKRDAEPWAEHRRHVAWRGGRRPRSGERWAAVGGGAGGHVGRWASGLAAEVGWVIGLCL